MEATTIKTIKDQTAKLLPTIEQLNKIWDRPIIAMCAVLIQNLSFDGSHCSNYSLDRDTQNIIDIHKAIELLNKQSYGDSFINWLWLEVDSIVTGNIMSEGFK